MALNYENRNLSANSFLSIALSDSMNSSRSMQFDVQILCFLALLCSLLSNSSPILNADFSHRFYFAFFQHTPSMNFLMKNFKFSIYEQFGFVGIILHFFVVFLTAFAFSFQLIRLTFLMIEMSRKKN